MINGFFIRKKWLTEDVHWMTSRHESPSLATNLNHSPASLSLHNSFSNDSSFLGSSCCLFTRCAAQTESENIFLFYYTHFGSLDNTSFLFLIKKFMCNIKLIKFWFFCIFITETLAFCEIESVQFECFMWWADGFDLCEPPICFFVI